MFFFPDKKKYTPAFTQGFSLVELMITIAIVVLVTGALMSKYATFNGVVLLKNQAYELALDIRQAQVFSVSTKGNGSNFRKPYGIYIDRANPNEYLLFQDVNDNLVYDPGEIVGEVYPIDSRFKITRICEGSNCDTATTNRQHVSISFKRPNFDARIKASSVSGTVPQVEITLSSVKSPNFSRVVTVYQSGQISVLAP